MHILPETRHDRVIAALRESFASTLSLDVEMISVRSGEADLDGWRDVVVSIDEAEGVRSVLCTARSDAAAFFAPWLILGVPCAHRMRANVSQN